MNQELFETETVARLHADQGRSGEAIAIYRRLCERHPANPNRARWENHIRDLMARMGDDGWVPLEPEAVDIPAAPGVIAVSGRDADGRTHAVIAWALPPTEGPPLLEVLLVSRGTEGVETETRRVPLSASSGRIRLHADNLFAAVAAAGHLDPTGRRFVPMVRSTARS
jgi:hypothetical protein